MTEQSSDGSEYQHSSTTLHPWSFVINYPPESELELCNPGDVYPLHEKPAVYEVAPEETINPNAGNAVDEGLNQPMENINLQGCPPPHSSRMSLLHPHAATAVRDSRRLSINPAELIACLNSSNFNRTAIREFFNQAGKETFDSADQPYPDNDNDCGDLYFNKTLRDKTIEVGADFAMSVEVSLPDIEAFWELDGMELIPENSDKYTFVSEGRMHVLLVHASTFDDEGEYVCQVGHLTTEAYVTVIDGKPMHSLIS